MPDAANTASKKMPSQIPLSSHIMKSILFAAALLLLSGAAFAWHPGNKDSAAYQKNPTLPAFNILSLDSNSEFNTYNIPEGRPTALMLFSPDCDHCKALTKEMLEHDSDLGDLQIYMVSFLSLPETRAFYQELRLDTMKRIVMVGKDYNFFFPTFYHAAFVPDIAFYNREKKLVKYLDEHIRIKDIIEAAREAGSDK